MNLKLLFAGKSNLYRLWPARGPRYVFTGEDGSLSQWHQPTRLEICSYASPSLPWTDELMEMLLGLAIFSACIPVPTVSLTWEFSWASTSSLWSPISSKMKLRDCGSDYLKGHFQLYKPIPGSLTTYCVKKPLLLQMLWDTHHNTNEWVSLSYPYLHGITDFNL